MTDRTLPAAIREYEERTRRARRQRRFRALLRETLVALAIVATLLAFGLVCGTVDEVTGTFAGEAVR